MMTQYNYRSVVLALSFITLASGCADEQEEVKLEAPLRQVRSIEISAAAEDYTRSFSGTLHASQETSLSFKVSGTINDIAVKVGDRVKKGDVIARLDPSTYELQAQRSSALLTEAEATLRNAKAEYARAQQLYEDGNVSRSQLDDARASSESAGAAVQSVRKALEIDRLELSYTKLTAEDDCSIASVDADEGENIAQGTQIFFAACGDDLEVQLDIPESVIASISENAEVEVAFSAIKDQVYKGVVSEVGVSSVDSGTTFPVTVVITDENTSRLKAGLSADVAFSITNGGAKSAAIVVPPFTLGEDQTGRYAFVLQSTEDGTALVRRQPVVVGNVLAEGIEVLEGLEPGTRVVTAGVSVLRDGMKVLYQDE